MTPAEDRDPARRSPDGGPRTAPLWRQPGTLAAAAQHEALTPPRTTPIDELRDGRDVDAATSSSGDERGTTPLNACAHDTTVRHAPHCEAGEGG
jgi:hypothetical protein